MVYRISGIGLCSQDLSPVMIHLILLLSGEEVIWLESIACAMHMTIYRAYGAKKEPDIRRDIDSKRHL